MNILMTGGTGFIGSRLVDKLVAEGHHIYILTRQPKTHQDSEFVSFISYQYNMRRLPFIHAVVNLAGESLFGLWTEARKKRIIDSRVKVTEQLTRLFTYMNQKPNVFISGSAIGFYGMDQNQIFTEKTTDPADDFLADVTHAWEASASAAEDLGIRTVYARFGIVLDKSAGALPKMALPFKFGLGGRIGDGQQWMSWVHIDDCVNLLYTCLTNKAYFGPINFTAPQPVQNKTFTQTLGAALRRPHFLPVPDKLFSLALGEMSQLITSGQYVLPEKALSHDFSYQYPELADALYHIYD